jgi:hypothetical protein
MLLAKSAITVLCTKVKRVPLLVVAHCLLVSKLLVQAGVLHTLRRLNALLGLTSNKRAASAAFLLALFGAVYSSVAGKHYPNTLN